MVKKIENKNTEGIKKALEVKKIVIGTERTMKELKKGTLTSVYLSSNCPVDIKEDIAHYSSLISTEVIELDVPNDELGIVCKKPFSVSILGILK